MGIELHWTAQLTTPLVRGFENGGHHFPAAESALPAVNVPPTDVPFFSLLPLLLCCCARSLPNCHRLSAGESVVVCAHLSLALHFVIICRALDQQILSVYFLQHEFLFFHSVAKMFSICLTAVTLLYCFGKIAFCICSVGDLP